MPVFVTDHLAFRHAHKPRQCFLRDAQRVSGAGQVNRFQFFILLFMCRVLSVIRSRQGSGGYVTPYHMGDARHKALRRASVACRSVVLVCGRFEPVYESVQGFVAFAFRNVPVRDWCRYTAAIT